MTQRTEDNRKVRGDETDREALLSAREAEVLELVVNGLSARKAAEQLSLSPRTVERHIINIRHKLNARNRAHLVSKAIALGEISLAGPASERSSD